MQNIVILPHLILLLSQSVHCNKQRSFLDNDKMLYKPNWLPHIHIYWNDKAFLKRMNSKQVLKHNLVLIALKVVA